MLELLSALAVFRLSTAIVNEDGPAQIFARLRYRLRGLEGISCYACVSFWLALPPALLFPYWPLHWLGFAGAALLLEALHSQTV